MKRASIGLLAAAALVAVLLACQVAHAACTDPNCKTCAVEATCTECKDHYGLVTEAGAYKCKACEDKNCQKCDGKETECSKCDADYTLNEAKKCDPKKPEPAKCNNIEGCEKCDTKTPTKCTTCSEGFHLTAGAKKEDADKCEPCKVGNCTACDKDVAVCEKCKAGQQPAKDGKSCVKSDAAAGATMLPVVGALVAAAAMVLSVCA